MAKRLSDAIKKAFKKTLVNDNTILDNQNTSKKRSADEENDIESVDQSLDQIGDHLDDPDSPIPGPSGSVPAAVQKKQKTKTKCD